MSIWLILVIALILLSAVVIAAVLLRSRSSALPAHAYEASEANLGERQQRQQAVESLGRDLLDRRIALDARRGTLQGNAALDEELDDLERRRRAGEISEDEFERRKIRLLGG